MNRPPSPPSGLWLTWANALTGVRALLAVPCAYLAAEQCWTWAAVLLTLAILTDFADGPLARRLEQSSALGGLMDHTTDAAFVAALLTGLWTLGYVPWLLPVLVAASFLQYVTDSRAHHGRALRASWLGRCNGIGYFVVAALPVYRNALSLPWPPDPLLEALAWLLVASTAVSMIDRWRVSRAAE